MRNKNIPLLILLLIFSTSATAQRISLGASFRPLSFQQVKFDENYLVPQNSFLVYYTGNSKRDNQPVFDTYEGIGLGLIGVFEYKRFEMSTEVFAAYNTAKISVVYPSVIGQAVDGKHWGEFKVTEYSIAFPVLLYYKLTPQATTPFISGGYQYQFSTYSENARPPLGTRSLISKNEMQGILYNNPNYSSLIIGAGYKKESSYFSLRSYHRLATTDNPLPKAKYITIVFSVSSTISFQQLRKGHIIHID